MSFTQGCYRVTRTTLGLQVAPESNSVNARSIVLLVIVGSFTDRFKSYLLVKVDRGIASTHFKEDAIDPTHTGRFEQLVDQNLGKAEPAKLWQNGDEQKLFIIGGVA